MASDVPANKPAMNPARLRLLACIAVGWAVFGANIPGFLMRVFHVEAPGVSAIAWIISIVLIVGITGYLSFGFVRERRITWLVLSGLFFLVISQVLRVGFTMGMLDAPALVAHQNTIRAADNLVNGIGLALIGLAFLFLLIELLSSRQQLMQEHAILTKEVARRQTVEKHLREREALLRGISSSAWDGIIALDSAGAVTFWNPAAENLLGYTADHMMGVPLSASLAPPDESTASLLSLCRPATTSDAPSTGGVTSLKAKRKNGTKLDVEVSISSMHLEGEQYAVCIVRDVTERNRMEAEKRDFEAQMQHTQKLESLGVLAGGIAHDFNNILQIMMMTVNVLETETPPETTSSMCVEKLKRAVNRGAALTQQMLAYSGKKSIALAPLNLGESVNDTVAFVQSLVSKKARFQLDIATDLPVIQADAAQVEQVVMNLVLNASEALDEMQGGLITISTRVVQYTDADSAGGAASLFNAKPGTYVCVEVSDTGCGMDKEMRDKIFDPFFTTKFTGRGLGMSAVLGIMRAHKGTVKINSTPGTGTTIQALFPVNTDAAAMPSATEQPAPLLEMGNNRTVLVVEDEPDALALDTLLLKQLGYTVRSAADGVEAIAAFEAHQAEIDCVLLDLSMPRMDGLQALQEIRRLKPSIPVLLVSGYAEDDLESRLKDLNIQAFLEKPYDAHTLAATLAGLFA